MTLPAPPVTPGKAPRPPLAARLGVVVPVGFAAELQAHLDAATADTLDTLLATGEIPADADLRYGQLVLPRSVGEVLALTITDARQRGHEDHADALVLQYLEALPRARLVQLLTRRAPHAWLFHAPVPWAALPRFRRGLERVFALLETSGVPPNAALGAPDAATFLARTPTLADFFVATYYGQLQPMFAALDHDLARIATEAEAAHAAPPTATSADGSQARWDAVDRRLSNAMLHELLHFGRAREAIFPPYLDEAIAAHFGLLLDPTVAFPLGRDDTALIGWSWFSQVGAALARVVGDGPLLAAQAGFIPWSEAIPEPLLTRLESDAFAAYRAAPAVHFHPDTTRPDRWVQLIYQLVPPRADPARDEAMLVDALTAMCLHAEQVGGAWCVTRRAPDGPVTIDFAAGVVRAPARLTGWEPAPLLHALPPALMAVVRASLTLTLDPDPDAIRATARALMQDLASA